MLFTIVGLVLTTVRYKFTAISLRKLALSKWAILRVLKRPVCVGSGPQDAVITLVLLCQEKSPGGRSFSSGQIVYCLGEVAPLLLKSISKKMASNISSEYNSKTIGKNFSFPIYCEAAIIGKTSLPSGRPQTSARAFSGI